VQADDPWLVIFTTCVIWPGAPLFAPRAKLRFAGWHVPAACACVGAELADGAALAEAAALADGAALADDPVLADAAALAGAEAAALLAELLELCDEHPAATSPAAETQTSAIAEVEIFTGFSHMSYFSTYGQQLSGCAPTPITTSQSPVRLEDFWRR
jgi:hypothetical protein